MKRLNQTAKYYEKLFTISESWQQPQLLDTVAKELFFSDNILFVEGQEDVGLINKFVLDNGPSLEFDIFGYGVGGAGNIIHLLEMAKDLGIRTGALYDGDKKEDYEKAKAQFTESMVSLLPKDDIRDKMKRDPSDCKKETKEIEKEGIFDKSGNVKDEFGKYLFKLLGDFNSFFTRSDEKK